MSENNHYLEAAVDKQKEVYRNLFVSLWGVRGVVHQVSVMFMNHFEQTTQGSGSHSNKCLTARVLLVDFAQILGIVIVLA